MIAVITGDLVSSSALTKNEYESLLELLEQRLRNLKGMPAPEWEFYRGDSFQIVVTRPQHAAKIAVLIAGDLIHAGHKATLSIGVGDYRSLHERPSLSQGQAFELSGRGLDSSARGELTFHSDIPAHADALALTTRFVSFLLNGLTRKQAEVLCLYIDMDCAEHQLLAERLGTTRQNVSSHLKRAGASLIEDYLALFARLMTEKNA
ncbi:MarR family transcriptional regulator [Aliidiomarina sp. Khilg15.8]